MAKMCIAFFISICIGAVSGVIEPIPLPDSLEECINYKVDQNKGSGVPLHVIQNLCLGKFITFETPHSWVRNLTNEEHNYVKSLHRKIISESEGPFHSRHRFKRDTLFPKRIRREVRAAPFKQWDDYRQAVRRLKFQEIGPSGRSRYDTIADIHMTAINSSHFGPNFLPWHRLYLLTFETALGVPIPYWDSTIDYELPDPTKSIMWSAKYFGNGFGKVKTGPFAHFQTPAGPLIRNIGSDGSLFNKRDVNLIFTKSHLKKISEPTAEEKVSFEGQHNSVHNWVDGQMNTQEFSPHDPLFWTHHSFVDYIWELFRKTQRTRGVDPVFDNPEPPENVTFQAAKDPSVGLAPFYNSDGYSNRVANMVIYEPHPECPNCGDSPDLVCDHVKRICISVLRNPHEYAGNREDAQEIADRMIEATTGRRRRVFSEYVKDERVRGDSLTLRKKIAVARALQRGSSSISNRELNDLFSGDQEETLSRNFPTIPTTQNKEAISYSPLNMDFGNLLPAPTVDVIYGPLQLESIMVYPESPNPQYFTAAHPQPQFPVTFTPFNPYMTDMRTRGDSMTTHYFRTKRSVPENLSLNEKTNTGWKPSLENTFFLDGKTKLDSWALIPVKVIYKNASNSEINRISKIADLQSTLGEQRQNCAHEQNNRIKIYVQSYGLNYYGKYKDSMTYQRQQSAKNLIGVKKPTTKAVETFVSAYDSCGNTCHTLCLIPGILPPVYKTCTGAVSISNKEPLMYEDIFAANQNKPGLKYSKDNPVSIIFVCEV